MSYSNFQWHTACTIEGINRNKLSKIRLLYLANAHASITQSKLQNWIQKFILGRFWTQEPKASIQIFEDRRRLLVKGLKIFLLLRNLLFGLQTEDFFNHLQGAFACFSCIFKRLLSKTDHHDFSKMIPILWVNCNFPNWVICIRPGLF